MIRKRHTIICFSVSVLLLVGGCQSTVKIEVEANQRSLKKTKKYKSSASTSLSLAVPAVFATKLAKATRQIGKKENTKDSKHKLQGILKKKATQKRPYIPQIKGIDTIKKYLNTEVINN